MIEHEYTLPDAGKALKWKSLSAQTSIDVRSSKGISDAALTRDLYLRRIVSYGTSMGSFNMADFGDWSEFDLESFIAEVDEVEGARKAAFRKAKVVGHDPLADLKESLTNLVEATRDLGKKAQLALEAGAIAASVADPLASGRT